MYEREGYCTECAQKKQISRSGKCAECAKANIVKNIGNLKRGREKCQPKQNETEIEITPAKVTPPPKPDQEPPAEPTSEPEKSRGFRVPKLW